MVPIRILICDDHPVVREGVRGMIRDQPDLEVVGEAGNGGQAAELALSLRPDVVLMDLKMPGLDGAYATTRIKAIAPSVRVLIVTTYQNDPALVAALKGGADGCLLKDSPKEELFAAIRGLSKGETPLAPAIRATVLRVLRKNPAKPNAEPTDRELEVLLLVARGYTNAEVGRRLFISSRTVTNHLQSLFGKLRVKDRTAAVTEALKGGLIDLGDLRD